MAHVARPLKVAQLLGTQNYEIHFALTRDPGSLLPALLLALRAFTLHQIQSQITESVFLESIARGVHPFTTEILLENIKLDCDIIKKVQPDLIIGDMRLSLLFSAKLMGVPYFNLSNITWDPHFKQKKALPDLPIVRILGRPLAMFLYPIASVLIQKKLMKSFNEVARIHKFKLFTSYFEILTSSDHTFYFDLLSFKQPKVPGQNQTLVGPLDCSFEVHSETQK